MIGLTLFTPLLPQGFLLFLNGVAVINNERFLERCKGLIAHRICWNRSITCPASPHIGPAQTDGDIHSSVPATVSVPVLGPSSCSL